MLNTEEDAHQWNQPEENNIHDQIISRWKSVTRKKKEL